MNKTQKTEKGFALLLAMIISGVVMSIGLSMLSVTLKQLDLGTSTRGSEVAFQAAAAGMDCVRFLRNDQPDEFVQNNQTVDINCFGLSLQMSDIHGSGGQWVLRQRFNKQFDWDTGSGDICVEIDAYVLDATGADINWTTGERETLSCTQGGVCTFAFSQGYNVSCSALGGNINAVQRELSAEF